jgi:hypothetical protein
MLKQKRQGKGLDVKTFYDDDKKLSYIVYRYPTESGTNSYHVFVEVEAKNVAKLLGIEATNTANAWNKLWEESNEN